MGAKVLSPDPGETLDVQNKKEELDGTGGINRESLAILATTDDTPGRSVRLALRLRLRPRKQQVLSFQLFNGTRWNELVPDMESESVSADAQSFWHPPNINYYWQGYIVPADWVPRPFIATYTKIHFSNAWSGAQRIDYVVNYDPNTFAHQHIIGHSDVQHRPALRKRRKKVAKKAPVKGRRRGRRA